MGKMSIFGAVLLFTAAGFGLTGCQTSPWMMRNPFERKPKPEIKSPAEMDDIQLKAPPERYTKDDYLRNAEKSERSLAQTGEYGEKENSAVSETREPEKSAMRDSSESSSSQAAPGFDDYPNSVPFAPGSIGDTQLR